MHIISSDKNGKVMNFGKAVRYVAKQFAISNPHDVEELRQNAFLGMLQKQVNSETLRMIAREAMRQKRGRLPTRVLERLLGSEGYKNKDIDTVDINDAVDRLPDRLQRVAWLLMVYPKHIAIKKLGMDWKTFKRAERDIRRMLTEMGFKDD